MRTLALTVALAVALAACGDPDDTDPIEVPHTCESQADAARVAACYSGCDYAESLPGPGDLGRLTCIFDDPMPTRRDLDLPDQGEGPAYQAGFAACYFEAVREAYVAQGCDP